MQPGSVGDVYQDSYGRSLQTALVIWHDYKEAREIVKNFDGVSFNGSLLDIIVAEVFDCLWIFKCWTDSCLFLLRRTLNGSLFLLQRGPCFVYHVLSAYRELFERSTLYTPHFSSLIFLLSFGWLLVSGFCLPGHFHAIYISYNLYLCLVIASFLV